MVNINYKREVKGESENVVEEVTEALKTQGFGVLTRIDLHHKIKEKLGREISPVVILGACNPQLAYEAFQRNPDVASLLPCNAVVREVGPGTQSVEIARPSALLRVTEDTGLEEMSKEADERLLKALDLIQANRPRDQREQSA